MKRIIVGSLFFISILISVYCIPCAEEVLFFNSWETNPLSLTREELLDFSGKVVRVGLPAAILVDSKGVYIFDRGEPIFVVIDESGKVVGTYNTADNVYYPFAVAGEKVYMYRSLRNNPAYQVVEYDMTTRQVVELFLVEHLAGLQYDETDNIFYYFSNLGKTFIIYDSGGNVLSRMDLGKRYAEWDQKYFADANYIWKDTIYSPTMFYRDARGYLASPCMSKFNLTNKSVKRICSVGHEFGNYILGIDNKGHIFTTQDRIPTSIYIHDKNGQLLTEIVPDYRKYGVDEKTSPWEYVHIPYIRDNGEIYLLVRVTKGLYVIKYSPFNE